MNEQLLYTLIGSALAVGGGFLAQRNQLILNRQEEDQRLLWEVETYLLDYHASYSQLTKHDSKEQRTEYESKLMTYRVNLNKIALRLKSKKYKQIALRIIKFCLDDKFRTPQNLYELTRQVQLNINDKIIKTYEKEIKESSGEF